MVFATIWIGGRSDLIVMERDPDAPRGGYTMKSYLDALEEGLLPFYEPDYIFSKIMREFIGRKLQNCGLKRTVSTL
jgi:hypothetical protein